MVVLVKEFSAAKERLSPALDASRRFELARANAWQALLAARAGDHVLAVAGGPAAAALAREAGAEVLAEEAPGGQNLAARRGIDRALAGGAGAVLLLSSDIPKVSEREIAAMISHAAALGSPAVLAAPATGRGGTNALYLAPPDAIDLHFGDDSLRLFRAGAQAAGAAFDLHQSAALALDLDEPRDLEELARWR